jgi:hypothetical protein
MKAILTLNYHVSFRAHKMPSGGIIGAFESEISIPALPIDGNDICFPVIADLSEVVRSPDDCKVTSVAFDLKKGICIPHIYCKREINGEECFEAGDNPDSEEYKAAFSRALKDLNEDVWPRLKNQGFKKLFIAV